MYTFYSFSVRFIAYYYDDINMNNLMNHIHIIIIQ